ncbi:MAG TPA: hypothetical protein VFH61_07290 [Thermoleophilia bacterium]|nr:hypothetical protein [Thermoleophilia bacterium]
MDKHTEVEPLTPDLAPASFAALAHGEVVTPEAIACIRAACETVRTMDAMKPRLALAYLVTHHALDGLYGDLSDEGAAELSSAHTALAELWTLLTGGYIGDVMREFDWNLYRLQVAADAQTMTPDEESV